MRIVLPFSGWRVPVALLQGVGRSSGASVILLAAGRERWTEYLTKRLFANEPVVVREEKVPVWSLQRLLNRWQSDADLTLVGIDRVSAFLFLDRGFLGLPYWITSWLKVPEDLQDFGRSHGRAAADMRRVRIHGLTHQISHVDDDLDEFYDRFYVPHIGLRHGVRESLAPRWMIRLLFRQGQLMWVTRDGERLAGGITAVRGKHYVIGPIGVRDGRQELLREGALAAQYVYSIRHAREEGCDKVFMGGSKPSLHDGVLHYKKKWAGGLCAHDGYLSANHVMLLRWNRLAGPVAEFLSHTSLIHHDQGGYSALWVFPADVPLTADNLRMQHRELEIAGLHRFRILLPGEVPPGFVCPPEVRLIPLEVAEQAGSDELGGLE